MPASGDVLHDRKWVVWRRNVYGQSANTENVVFHVKQFSENPMFLTPPRASATRRNPRVQ